MEMITSLSNPLVKRARALRQKKNRVETDSFLVEGIHHVGEAFAAGWQLETVLYAPDQLTSAFARDLLAKIPKAAQPVSGAVMDSLAEKENPQGILAITRQRHTILAELPPFSRAVALTAPQDPGNVGTILRTIDAVGADVLFLLDGGVELYHPTVVRASMGTLFWKPIVQTSFAEFLPWLRRFSCQLIGASAKADVSYAALQAQTTWVLLLGNEQKGLSREQSAACDLTVSLPMRGRVSSLNLAVAAGVLLYRLME
ncbi:MAG: RNA methyltransferase [Anaerolineales bacterium]